MNVMGKTQKRKRCMHFGFEGILFDLDGTLVDSSAVIRRAWLAYADRHKLDVEEDFIHAIQGKPAREAITILRPDASLREVEQDTKWLEMIEANDTDGVVALSGAVELLDALNKKNIPWAIVTSGTIPVATSRIKAAGLPFPKVLITPELVSRGKPDPEPYVLGAEKLGVDIHKCIVFEDSPAGIKSGISAGAIVVGVTTQFDSAYTLMAEQANACSATLRNVELSIHNRRPVISISEMGNK